MPRKVIELKIDKETELFHDLMKNKLPKMAYSKDAIKTLSSFCEPYVGEFSYLILKIVAVYYDIQNNSVAALKVSYSSYPVLFRVNGTELSCGKSDTEILAVLPISSLSSLDFENIKNNMDELGGRKLYTTHTNVISEHDRKKIIGYLEEKHSGMTGFSLDLVTLDITNPEDIRLYQVSYTRKGIASTYCEDKKNPRLVYNHKYSAVYQALGTAFLKAAIDNLGSASAEDFRAFEEKLKEQEIDKVIKKICDAFPDFSLKEHQGFFKDFDRPVAEFYLEEIDVLKGIEKIGYDSYKITDYTNVIKALRKLHGEMPTEEERDAIHQEELDRLISYLEKEFGDYGFKVDDDYHGGFASRKEVFADFYLEDTDIHTSHGITTYSNKDTLGIRNELQIIIRKISIPKLKNDPRQIALEKIKEQFPEMYFSGDAGFFPDSDVEIIRLEAKKCFVRVSLKRMGTQTFFYSSLSEILQAIGRVKASIEDSKKSLAANTEKKAIAQKNILIQEIKSRFPRIVFDKDLNHGFFDVLDEDVIFIEGERTRVRESFDTKELKEFSTGNTKDILSSILKLKDGIPSKAKDYIRTLEELEESTVVQVYESREKITEMMRAFQYLSDLKISLSIVRDCLKRCNRLVTESQDIRMDKITKVKEMITEYKDTLNEELKEQILDSLYELTDKEEIFIQDLIHEFDSFVIDEGKETITYSGKRRVYIRKRLIKQYMSFPKDARDSINEIVRNMRTLDGHEFLVYLRNRLRMNEPHSPINHKVRLRNVMDSQMRMCFWQGKDFADREESRSDIYIYSFVLEHDRDIERLKDIVPEDYVENDFVIFTLDQNFDSALRIPELKKEQFRLASSLDGPKVVYGCAGSGKTLVSIDQYWQIEKDYQITGEKIAYVTFQKTLKKNAEDMIRALGVTPYCYTLPEYFLMLMRITNNTRRITGEAEFLEWFNDYYIENGNLYNHNQEITGILRWNDCDRIVYTYFRGIYKGSSALAKVRKESHLSESEFFNELKVKEEFLSDTDIKEIFAACERYRTVMEENDWIDDNDLAYQTLSAIREEKARQMDYLLIDEVQDLTALQVYAVISSLSKNKRDIYFYGDPHQTVNPTIFDDSVLKGAVSDLMGLPLKESDSLAEIHRTNENLKQYLMTLQRKRKEFLGSYMDGYARIPETEKKVDSKDDMWAAYITGEALESFVLHEGFNKGAVIITPDQVMKEKILKKYKDIDENRIFTIYEAKGMEWDKAILYHMLSSSVSYFTDMVEGRAKKSTICRMFYNKFYVAATRARDTFLLVEDEIPKSVADSMLESLPEIREESQVSLYLGEEATFEEWVYEANRFLDAGEYKRAYYPMLKARTLVTTKEEYGIITKLFRKSRLNEAPKEELLTYAEEAYKAKEYASAAAFYINAGAYPMANLCRIMDGLPIKKMEYMREFLDAGIPVKHPECMQNLIDDPLFREILKNLHERLYGE